jgi:hypothetical protein
VFISDISVLHTIPTHPRVRAMAGECHAPRGAVGVVARAVGSATAWGAWRTTSSPWMSIMSVRLAFAQPAVIQPLYSRHPGVIQPLSSRYRQFSGSPRPAAQPPSQPSPSLLDLVPARSSFQVSVEWLEPLQSVQSPSHSNTRLYDV